MSKKETKSKGGGHHSETGAGPTQGGHQNFMRTARAPTPENTGAAGKPTTPQKC